MKLCVILCPFGKLLNYLKAFYDKRMNLPYAAFQDLTLVNSLTTAIFRSRDHRKTG